MTNITKYIVMAWGSYRRLSLFRRALLFLLLIEALQLCIPSGSVSVFARLDGVRVGLKTQESLSREVTARAAQLTLRLHDQKVQFSGMQAGVTPDTRKTLQQLPSVQLTDKLLPGAPLIKLLRPVEVTTVKELDEQRLRVFAEELAVKYSVTPKDAAATVRNGNLEINRAADGLTFDSEDILRALKELKVYGNEVLVLQPRKVPPQIAETAVTDIQHSFAKVAGQKLIVKYGNTMKTYEAEAIRDWMEAAYTPENKKWILRFKASALQEVIQSWAKEYNVASGITQVTMVDDIETSRKTGAAGRALDEDKIRVRMGVWMANPSAEPMPLDTKTLPPRVVVTKSYTRSSAQLQAKLNAWIASHSGQYQIAIQELNGRGRTASHNVSQQTVMASTYKLFLAFVAYRQSESGALNLGTTLPGGKTIEKCIESMIVNSENECAVELGRYIGWAKADSIIAAAGFQNVKLNNYDAAGNLKGDKLVNANELARFLAQLSGNSLINNTNTASLVGYMKRQTYRQGIPAGSRGAVVADKVGFLEGYLHDAAIVYAPNSTYALVVMSSGSSWTNISDLARAVYDFMAE